MGIGRRDFLELFGATLAALAVSASPAATLIDDLYINRKLGIAFKKFSGWHFSNVLDMGQVKDGQILALDDIELAQQLKDETKLPLITVSKEPVLTGSQNFAPGINVYLDRYVLTDDGEAHDPELTMHKDMAFLKKVLRQFDIISPPRALSVSNCTSIEYVSSFLFEHVNLAKPTHVRMNSLLVIQEPAWYTFRMYDSPYLGVENIVEYDEFVESLQII